MRCLKGGVSNVCSSPSEIISRRKNDKWKDLRGDVLKTVSA
jgi:hypothetical protein